MGASHEATDAAVQVGSSGASGGMADAGDLKSPAAKAACGFESRLAYLLGDRLQAGMIGVGKRGLGQSVRGLGINDGMGIFRPVTDE